MSLNQNAMTETTMHNPIYMNQIKNIRKKKEFNKILTASISTIMPQIIIFRILPPKYYHRGCHVHLCSLISSNQYLMNLKLLLHLTQRFKKQNLSSIIRLNKYKTRNLWTLMTQKSIFPTKMISTSLNQIVPA